ncbi:hypothetical protein CANCADRAFT_16659, partial [Tortispora caseinolytica NRRL Y-17796]
PRLAHNLDRALFSPGVHYLQDPRSHVYNFDPYLGEVMSVGDFDFRAIPAYTVTSKDKTLSSIAERCKARFIASSSSITGILSKFHYAMFPTKKYDVRQVSHHIKPDDTPSFSSRLPAVAFLRRSDNGIYALDASKAYDYEHILTHLGKTMELLLTSAPAEFEKYRMNGSESQMRGSEIKPDTYHYSQYKDFLLRSQIDCYDPRLPGTGTFDLKTRACVSVRHDLLHSQKELGSGYQITKTYGQFESFEREFHDMIRTTMLKYALQARVGRMDGIFVAYHNIQRFFGFEYIPLETMDALLYNGGSQSTAIAETEFMASLQILREFFDMVSKKHPGKSFRLHFEDSRRKKRMDQVDSSLAVFVEVMDNETVEKLQSMKLTDVKGFIPRSLLGDTNDSVSESEFAKEDIKS